MIQNIQVGSRVRVTAYLGGVFYSRNADQVGTVERLDDDGSTIFVRFDHNLERDYGRVSNVTLVSVEPLIKFLDLKAGMKVKVVGKGNDRHEHWGIKVGSVYDVVSCGSRQGLSTPGGTLTTNYAEWTFTVVREAPATLNAHLAALKAELEDVKAEIATAAKEVVIAQSKVDVAEAKRVALNARLTSHGIQFIGEKAAVVTAQDAHEADELEEGVRLLTVQSSDTDENTVGSIYKIIRVDADDSNQTYKLESNDGYGWWVNNTDLKNYTVVA